MKKLLSLVLALMMVLALVPAVSSAATYFTTAQVLTGSVNLRNWIESNKSLPNYVTINGSQVSMPAYLRIASAVISNINSGSTGTQVQLISVNTAPNPSENNTPGNLSKANYVDLANRVYSFIGSNGYAPNYASTPLGNVRYEMLVYASSRILAWYKENGNILPNYVVVTTWASFTSVPPTPPPSTPAPSDPYLKATNYCQVGHATIVSVKNTAIGSAQTEYQKALNIFNYLQAQTSYSYYYDSEKGAVSTWNSKTGNCCDLSHLNIAVARTAGLRSRYVHGYCTFQSGLQTGHVWAEIQAGGTWYLCDLSSSGNTFGNQQNVKSKTIYNRYIELPF